MDDYAMKQLILISDPQGYPLRVQASAEAAQTICICPGDKPREHGVTVALPEAWLPAKGNPQYSRRCWWVCDRHFIAAIRQLDLDADFYWCVESDVVANPDVWQRLILASESRASDGIFVWLTDRRPNYWLSHPTTPAWATHHHLGAMFRLSRRAVAWLEAAAEEQREVFCEVNTASVIRRAGGSLADLRDLGWFYNSQTMTAPPSKPIVNPLLFNHPLKCDGAEAKPNFDPGTPGKIRWL